jgi:uncharacterized protein DUF6101
METGGTAGSSRTLRLDPFALPVRFPASDAGADGKIRQIELHRERVIVRRVLRGMRMAVGVPVKAFRGVTLHLLPAENDRPSSVALTLDHSDPALSIPLGMTPDSEEAETVWKAWGRVLRLPLLVASAREEEDTVPIGEDTGRRRRRSAIKNRRPSICLRRKPGFANDNRPVHRGEREIIARN